MKKNKIILCSVILLLACLPISTLSAATIIRTGSVNSSYLTTYRYGYNYSVVLTYTGSGTITYANDIIISNKSCNSSLAIGSFGCSIIVHQSSKLIHSASSALTYILNVQVSSLTDIGIPIYVGSRNDTITVVMNRTNNRNPKDNDFTTTVVQGDLHYIQEDAEKSAQIYGVDIASIKQYHVNNDGK